MSPRKLPNKLTNSSVVQKDTDTHPTTPRHSPRKKYDTAFVVPKVPLQSKCKKPIPPPRSDSSQNPTGSTHRLIEVSDPLSDDSDEDVFNISHQKDSIYLIRESTTRKQSQQSDICQPSSRTVNWGARIPIDVLYKLDDRLQPKTVTSPSTVSTSNISLTSFHTAPTSEHKDNPKDSTTAGM